MPRAGDVLDLSPIGAIFRIKKTSTETQGRSFEMEWELFPNAGGTPVHIHPHATESYEVLAGELDLYVDGTHVDAAAARRKAVARGPRQRGQYFAPSPSTAIIANMGRIREHLPASADRRR
jgi:hypothetical protein